MHKQPQAVLKDETYNTFPRQRHKATLCNSPPERFTTSWSINCSIRSGFITSDTNWGWVYASRIFWCSKCLTVDWNFGLIFWGLYETLNSGISTSDPPSTVSGFNKPAWIKGVRWIDMQRITQFSFIKKQIWLKEYQHTNECCLSCPILTQHHNNLRISKFSFNYTKPEIALSFGHGWVFVSCICLSFLSTFLWSLSNLDTTWEQGEFDKIENQYF